MCGTLTPPDAGRTRAQYELRTLQLFCAAPEAVAATEKRLGGPMAEQVCLTDEENDRVANALGLIQEAHEMVSAAARELCGVRGFGDQWSASLSLDQAIKTYWHELNSRATKIRFFR